MASRICASLACSSRQHQLGWQVRVRALQGDAIGAAGLLRQGAQSVVVADDVRDVCERLRALGRQPPEVAPEERLAREVLDRREFPVEVQEE
jgi:hypothetical protein